MDKLTFISEQMAVIAIPYEFGEWTSEKVYPYFVGEINEEPPDTEDGAEVSTLMLTGWNRGDFITLEAAKKKIKKHFHPVSGLRDNTDSGSIAVFYEGAFPVPSGEADLKKIQINLKIKEWKGDL